MNITKIDKLDKNLVPSGPKTILFVFDVGMIYYAHNTKKNIDSRIFNEKKIIKDKNFGQISYKVSQKSGMWYLKTILFVFVDILRTTQKKDRFSDF